MDKKLGVLVIHGMGSQGEHDSRDSSRRSYSRRLFAGMREQVGISRMRDVAWREVHWARVLQGNQRDFLKRIKSKTAVGLPRKFVMQSLSDAGSYRYTGRMGDDTYERIHGEVARVLVELEGDLGPGAPIMVFAHSLGAHIMSNYIYDLQCCDAGRDAFRAVDSSGHPLAVPDTALQRMQTVVKFITFGCNIPVFVMGFDPNDVTPIAAPQNALPAALRQETWWHNYYDREDILGYPLAEIGAKYAALAGAGLEDRKINAGWGLGSFTWLSHNNYWHAAQMHRPVGQFMTQALDVIANLPPPDGPNGETGPLIS